MDRLFNTNAKNIQKNHTWTILFVRGKIDPKIDIEMNVIFVFYLHDQHGHKVCATSSSQWIG